VTEQGVTHHHPERFTVGPEATDNDDPMVTFTRRIADRLADKLAHDLDAVSFRRFPATAPAALDGWTRHEITIGEHEVIITGTPDDFGLPEYRVTVDDQDAPYQYTLDRPITELLADAAHQAITGQRAA
jgi:hypothetical protein